MDIDKDTKIGILGMGYVGLPLAMAFAKRYPVVGYDVNGEVKEILSNGDSHVRDVKPSTLKKYLNKTFFPTDEHERLRGCDFLIICVPTPLTEDRDPDLRYVKGACETIAKVLRKGHFIILESTTFPGTTEDIVIPTLEKSGLKAGVDFGVAYSPERIDPGSKGYFVENTPKIVGGIDRRCTDIAAKLYGSVVDAEIIKVRNCRTAEAAKMVENIFREVNIALVNELALIFERMDIDTWEVIEAARTKPFGFMPFYPGPGIGGHCIPLDPFYLSYKAKKHGIIPRFIELSAEINEFMKMHAVNLISEALRGAGRSIEGSTIAVLGLAYKKDVADTRESPSGKIVEELVNLGARVRVFDPYAKSIDTRIGKFESEEDIEGALRGADCAVFVVDHSPFRKLSAGDIREAMATPIVVDCKNVFKGCELDGISYYGIGKCNNRGV
jgi:UDP-N-acetyl-D-glucosamine dehydrogenase